MIATCVCIVFSSHNHTGTARRRFSSPDLVGSRDKLERGRHPWHRAHHDGSSMTAAGIATEERRRAAALAALVAGAIAMGASVLFVRWADVGPYASAFWRVFLALPFLFLWMRLE